MSAKIINLCNPIISGYRVYFDSRVISTLNDAYRNLRSGRASQICEIGKKFFGFSELHHFQTQDGYTWRSGIDVKMFLGGNVRVLFPWTSALGVLDRNIGVFHANVGDGRLEKFLKSLSEKISNHRDTVWYRR